MSTDRKNGDNCVSERGEGEAKQPAYKIINLRTGNSGGNSHRWCDDFPPGWNVSFQTIQSLQQARGGDRGDGAQQDHYPGGFLPAMQHPLHMRDVPLLPVTPVTSVTPVTPVTTASHVTELLDENGAVTCRISGYFTVVPGVLCASGAFDKTE